jgi:sterol desaturase/sphingolipid hydroxylase (fatty acid hydroxylase superfamily)
MGIALALLIGFFAFEAAGYVLHRLLHSRWTGSLNRAHMAHHLVKYPPRDFLSPSYRRTGSDSTLLRFVIAGVAVALLVALLFPLALSLPLLAELALIGGVNAYVHDSLHVDGHWLERYPWYRKWRQTHFVHHVDMTKNFGIVSFWADWVAGTYLD